MVFPVTPLDARTELLIGGTWTAITPVQGTDSIPVTRGHPDESTTTSPSSAGPLTLPDNDGRYSLRNPTGIYYPNLVRNVPLRVSVPSRSVYLRLEDDTGTSYAACPDSAGVSVTGDLDLRLDLALSGWQECVLAAKWTPGGGTQSSWLLALEDDGTLAFFWSTTGADALDARSTMPLPLRRGALRITLDVNNGAGGNTVTFFTGAAGGA